jgi:hypothetical protein
MSRTIMRRASRPTAPILALVDFQSTRMRCVESVSVPFSGVTSLILVGRDPMPDTDHGRW